MEQERFAGCSSRTSTNFNLMIFLADNLSNVIPSVSFRVHKPHFLRYKLFWNPIPLQFYSVLTITYSVRWGILLVTLSCREETEVLEGIPFAGRLNITVSLAFNPLNL